VQRYGRLLFAEMRRGFVTEGARGRAALMIKAASSIAAAVPLIAILALAAVATTIGPEPAYAANGSVVYTYDALGRVTSMSYDTNVITIYTYDSNGNRTTQVINVNTTALTWTATTTPCTTNCWGAGLWQ
jgi:YD repeat-containing protein